MFVLIVVIASARPARAQEAGQVGLTMAGPAAVGIIWQATDRLAIRPDFTFSHSSNSVPASSSSSVGIAVSALFYVRKWDDLRVYLSPRFGYQRSSFTYGDFLPSSSSMNAYSGSGSFGAEYSLDRRFAVFAETGLIYSRSSVAGRPEAPLPSLDSSTHTWGTRGGVGAIIYF
jgi:hypothetical protein